MAGSWACTYQSTATAAVKSLPSPLPDFTATRRSRSTARSTSSCLLHNFTPSVSDANRTGPLAASGALSEAGFSGLWDLTGLRDLTGWAEILTILKSGKSCF